MDLLTQLNRAVAYVEEHICDDLALSDVSTVTTYSPYHFGRIFYYIADMPLSEYIRRRKLSLAAMELQSGGPRVLDLAVKYGYDSADSFTRTFTRQHGVTPSAARKIGVMLKIFPPLTFQIKIEGVHEMNWRIEQKEAFEVFGIERCFKSGESDKIAAFWTETREDGSQAKLIKRAGCDNLIGVCCYDDSIINGCCRNGADVDECPYMIALPADGCDTSGYTSAKISAAAWAVFRESVEGYGQKIPELFRRAYSQWLPSSGYDKAPGPDLEIYGAGGDGKLFEEIWIPIVKN